MKLSKRRERERDLHSTTLFITNGGSHLLQSIVPQLSSYQEKVGCGFYQTIRTDLCHDSIDGLLACHVSPAVKCTSWKLELYGHEVISITLHTRSHISTHSHHLDLPCHAVQGTDGQLRDSPSSLQQEQKVRDTC